MNTRKRRGHPVTATPKGERDMLLLGAPWPSGDAAMICSDLTGVVVRICRLEMDHLPDGARRCGRGKGMRFPPNVDPEPCRALPQEGWLSLERAYDTPYRYHCPQGVPCACIPLAHVPSQPRAHIWVRACPEPAEAGQCIFSAGDSAPFERLADDDFDVAVNLLTVMAGSARCVARAPLSTCKPTNKLTAHQKSMVRHMCRAIHTRCSDAQLKLGRLAAENVISVAYLCTLFSRAVGVPFRSYLQAWRLHKVREWLSEDRLSIKEIALHAGFNDPNRLRLAFKSATGLAPREWRERRLSELMHVPV